MNRSMVGPGRSVWVGAVAYLSAVLRCARSSPAAATRSLVADAEGKTLRLAVAAVPGIMRAYSDGQSRGPQFRPRFVANSPINSQTRVEALWHRETAFREHGPQQGDL